jgi:hypothetical protein
MARQTSCEPIKTLPSRHPAKSDRRSATSQRNGHHRPPGPKNGSTAPAVRCLGNATASAPISRRGQSPSPCRARKGPLYRIWPSKLRPPSLRSRGSPFTPQSPTIAPLAASLGLLAVFSPIKLGQFQCPSPTQVFQFHCQLATALLLGDVHGFLLGNGATLKRSRAKDCDGNHQIVGSARLGQAAEGSAAGH